MKLVILDSLSLLNRAFYALPPTLTDKEGKPVNAIYGYLSMLSRIIKELKPTHLAAAFDVHAPTFRHKKCDFYKANRTPPPPEFTEQLPVIRNILRTMNIPVVEMEGFEADDIIGTLAKKFPMETVIVSGDQDILQLIDDTTSLWLTKGNMKDIVIYDEAKLKEDYALSPSQIIDLKALMGDKSDNIPGVFGVGKLKAVNLLSEFKDLDGVYAHIDEVKGKLKEYLVNDKENAYLSKYLATIVTDVPLQIQEKDLEFSGVFSKEAYELFEKYRFVSLLDKFSFEEKTVAKTIEDVSVKSEEEFDALLKSVSGSGIVALNISENVVSIAVSSDKNYSISVADDFLSLFSFANVISSLESILDSDKEIICFSVKDLLHICDENGICLRAKCFDVSIAHYLVNCLENTDSAEKFCVAAGYSSSAIAGVLFAEKENLLTELEQKGLKKLYYEVELPLAYVLFDMEKTGFRVDKNVLKEMNSDFEKRLKSLTDKIYFFNDGIPFNINSTQQLGTLLFDKLNLKKGKKTKTGVSTNAEVLQSLLGTHPIIELILEYRQLFKLNSTYALGLMKVIDSDGRIRTEFKQTLTQTGRLSSKEPNLQNIPVRDEEGRELRKAFKPSIGNVLVSADYSQIELRLLAHLSGDETLCDAFKHGKDIHSYTASLAFNIPLEEVTKDLRRYAKAINFGIIYGMSDYGLSTTINVPVKQAARFIENYYDTYPKIKEFMDSNVEFAKENGYSKTVLGRIRYIPELKSSNFNVRSFGERVAKNMPLQGSAADIIKLAMLKVYDRLKKDGLKSKLIMQVHDELIIDAPLNEVEKVKEILKEEMENAYPLSIPMTVDVAQGNDWFEAK